MAVRGIGRLRAGGSSAFSPSSIFSGGAKGLWLDPSDISTGFQDSAGTTPQTAAGQPTGRRNDKSGNANNVLQSSASARPTYDVISSVAADYFDGLDDGYATAAFSAGTLTADMDCFIAVKRASASNMIIASNGSGSGTFIGFTQSGNASPCMSNIGTAWSVFVDGVAVGAVNSCTRDQLHTALGSGSYKLLEVRNVNNSAWTQFLVGGYVSNILGADIGGVILCPAQSDDTRTNIRKWLGAKVGLSL